VVFLAGDEASFLIGADLVVVDSVYPAV